METGASNSDAMTLPINDWLFHLEGGTIHHIAIALSPIHNYRSEPSFNFIVFGFAHNIKHS